MTLAPQSASWRTQVGPARTRVRSSTVRSASAGEAESDVMKFSSETRAGKPNRSKQSTEYARLKKNRSPSKQHQDGIAERSAEADDGAILLDRHLTAVAAGQALHP